jgi:hypothetical protein
MKLTSSRNGCTADPLADPLNVSAIPETLANNLLAKLEKFISNLLKMLPNASKTDEIAIFTQNVSTDIDGEDAW